TFAVIVGWYVSFTRRNTAPAPPKRLVASPESCSIRLPKNSKKETMFVLPDPLGPTNTFSPGFRLRWKSDSVLNPLTSTVSSIVPFPPMDNQRPLSKNARKRLHDRDHTGRTSCRLRFYSKETYFASHCVRGHLHRSPHTTQPSPNQPAR